MVKKTKISKELQEYTEVYSISENTRRAYRFDWESFTKYCKYNNLQSLPAKYETIGEYLTHCADVLNLKVSTISRHLAAIVRKHRDNEYPLDTKHKYIRPALKGIKNKKGSWQKGKKPLLTNDIKKMINSFGPADDIRSLRNKCLILIGFTGAFRRSELVNINFEDIENRIEGLIIHISKSKTDQEGKRIHEVEIPRSENINYCPVKFYDKWIKASQINSGPIFRKINKSNNIQEKRLSDRVVALIIKETMIKSSLEPNEYAGHSLRSGFATQAARGGADEKSIMKTTGHKSVQMVHRYIKDSRRFKNSAAKKLGL
tara:strand:+ start:170 stop:1117 length:948 start_codon:yes stop_codon:yes gene_type:complete